MGSRKSNPYDITSLLHSLSVDDHHVGSRKSNPYDITSLLLSFSLLMTIMWVHGNLTHMISPACFSLSLLMTIMWVHGNLTHMISPACFSLLLVAFPFSYSPLMTIVWLYITLILLDAVLKGTASRYPLITLLRIGIHSCRNYLLSYRGFYLLSYRTVGVRTDGNCCPYLLSPTAPAPRTRYIGDQVARFARPFESRPADPIRREVYRQLAAVPGSASYSGWVAPTATLPITPPPLQRGTEESTPRIVPPKRKGKQRFKC